ncbi:RNase H family protein [Sinorhizobium fredii]|uniref:RNase H family protein n=1 Tax=Rhizobium fredii TaxID=380 RepID=UPI0035197D7A
MTDVLQIYADGSFDAASRSGGWAFVVMEADCQIHVANGTMVGSSNNSFEVLSVLNAIFWLENEAPTMPVTIWTDSAHVVEGCSRWRMIWRGNGWKRIRSNSHERRRAIPDVKFWQQLDVFLERNLQVRIELCKGHSGIPGNDHADMAARAALTSIRVPFR